MPYNPGGKDINLVTYYNEGEDSHVDYGKTRWLAQTFTLTAQHAVWRFRLKSFTPWGGKFYEYGLRATDGAGKPLAIDLYHTSLSPTGESFYSPGKWKRFDFSEFPTLAPGTYAIVASVPTAPTSVAYKLRCDSSAPTYALGKAWQSTDSGVTWTEIPNTDLMFEVWGYEPPPEAPPEPSISNWAPLDMEYTSVLEGFTIVVTTDIPCHLYMRWTTTEPLKHPATRLVRGLRLMAGVRYCFVAFTENEQIEPGDTLIHTFVKRNWPICQTRWFYFVGTVTAELQPSASPIFYIHREDEYIPAVYGPVAATLSNRTIRYDHQFWTNCHDAPSGDLGNWHNPPLYNIVAGASLTLAFWVWRGFLFFDTSGIPPGSLVTAAVLSLYVKGWLRTSSVAYPHIYITQGVQNDPVIATNYGDQLPYTTIGGQRDIATLILNEYNDIDFNADGLPFINPGGVTKLCIRQEMDIKNVSPPFGTNYAWWWSSQKGAGYQALLTVYYVPP